jgi:fructose-1,6-bisphosphatase I
VRDCGRSGLIVSEEEEAPIAVQASAGGGYIACFDPIDGSSNIDAAVPTGSIWGIYSPGECVVSEEDSPDEVLRKCALNARKAGTELVSAGYCMYSSSTVLVLTLGKGVAGFTLDASIGEFVLSHPSLVIPDPGQKIFSGNLGNVRLWAPPLADYIATLLTPPEGGKPYSYRYIGALVGDFHRTLLYGGVWLYPPDAKAPSGKARLLYEVAPMALLAEQAGGLATWGATAEARVLDVVPQSVHQKSPMFVGSTSEVRRLQAFLKAHPGNKQ